MAADPYTTLGVARDATAAQIRSAYRKLAKKHHPDLNPGDKASEAKFKAISGANDLLSDPEKRARFDRGEIDAAGDPVPERTVHRGFNERGFSRGGGTADMSDMFADLFARQAREYSSQPARGRDNAYTLAVSFVDAVAGSQQMLTLPDGRTVDVKIPVGLEDGQTLRLRGQGGEGHNGGPAGDALIEVRVRPHPVFRREGDDILLELPVTLKEAVLGGRITVPTPTGAVTMTVPKRSDTGTVLRLRGRGVPAHDGRPAGDEKVTLKVVLGDVDEALEAFLQTWSPAHKFDPRKDIRES
jgi:DnaJ-class molecular chaperone